MKDRDIIVIGLQSWNISLGSNCKDIAREFSKNNRVLFVNAPISRLTLLRHRSDPGTRKQIDILKGRSEDLVKINDNFWVLNPRTVIESINQIRINRLFDFGNYINNRRYAREILSAAARLNFRNYILFNDNDMYRGFYLKEMLKPDLYIYYSRDNLQAMEYWKRQGARMEPKIIAKADLVLTNSDFLARSAKKFNRSAFNIGSGCDISLYDRNKITTVPPDIKSVPGPVIGYTGAILSMRLDPGLMDQMALENPGWSFVLIGPEDGVFRNSPLHQRNNVYFLGNKKPEELPAYINQFDVAINPQKVNEVTFGNYPRKIDEYLALGKPVVATRTEAMEIFNSHVYLARNNPEFSQLIRKALEENSGELIAERENFARTHSWEANVATIYSIMEKMMEERGRKKEET